MSDSTIYSASGLQEGISALSNAHKELTDLLETHVALTGSVFARRILDDFRDFLGKFWLVKPKAASLESLADDLRRAA